MSESIDNHPAVIYAAKLAMRQFELDDDDTVHGQDHWRRVERNGLYIAHRTNVDPVVVTLFARLHDCCRENEDDDLYHGPRAAELLRNDDKFRDLLTREQIEQAAEAMEVHTSARLVSDPTIGACLDADRLDLARLGLAPDLEYLSTHPARDVAETYDIDEIQDGVFCREQPTLRGRSTSPCQASTIGVKPQL